MATTVRELVTIWGFKVNTKPLRKMEGELRRIQGLAFKAGLALTGLGIGVHEMFSQIAEFQEAETGLEILTGSADSAKEAVKELIKFSGRAPVTFKELESSANILLRAGIKVSELNTVFETVGNISAATGGKNFGQLINAIGQLRTGGGRQSMVLLEFMRAGVPLVDILAQRLGRSRQEVKKLVGEGKIGFAQIFEAIQSTTQGTGRFAGALEKSTNNISDRLRNIRSSIQLIIKRASDSKGLSSLGKALGTLNKFLRANEKAIAQGLIKGLEAAVKLFKTLGYVLLAVVRVFNMFADAVGGMDNALNVILAISAAIFAFSFPLISVLGLLALLITDIVAFAKGKDSLIGRLIPVFEDLGKKMGEAMVRGVTGIFTGIPAAAGSFFKSFNDPNKIPEWMPGGGSIAGDVAILERARAGTPEAAGAGGINVNAQVNVQGLTAKEAEKVAGKVVGEEIGKTLRGTQRDVQPMVQR